MAIRVAIVDDEPLAVEILADYVQKTEGLLLKEATTDVFKVLGMVHKGELDLVLLDVQMPGLTGLQFMKIIENKCRVILTTAYTEYALDGYDFNVVDYLLKPISYDRFFKAIGKLAAPAGPEPAKQTAHIFVRSEYKLIRIALDDILYIESLRDYIAVHTVSHAKIMSLESMRNMEELLPADQFARIHKSYIISLSKIKFIEKNLVQIGNQSLPVGNTYRDTFNKIVNRG